MHNRDTINCRWYAACRTVHLHSQRQLSFYLYVPSLVFMAVPNHLFLWPCLCYHKHSEDWKVKNLLVLSKNQISSSSRSVPTAHWYWEKEDEREDHLPQQQPSFKME